MIRRLLFASAAFAVLWAFGGADLSPSATVYATCTHQGGDSNPTGEPSCPDDPGSGCPSGTQWSSGAQECITSSGGPAGQGPGGGGPPGGKCTVTGIVEIGCGEGDEGPCQRTIFQHCT